MEKNCNHCEIRFEIPEEDLEFFHKISPVFNNVRYLIPEPALCPDCRLQRRISWRNERALYMRACDLCKKNIVSVYSPGKPHPVYCNACWWGDGWDGHHYGREVDFSRPFFDQLREVMEVVPQLAIQNDEGNGSENCQYCQDFAHGKNCYFVVGSWHTENSFYSNVNASHNRSICDCINVSKSELVYESLDSQALYNCAFLQNSQNCSDCIFGFDLKGCRNCFGCFGLRQKEFYFFNEPLSEAEYKKKLTAFALDSYKNLELIKKQFLGWIVQFPHKSTSQQNCENCEGNDLFNCKNTQGFSLLDAENCKYCHQGDNNMFSYDIFNSGQPNWCYEGMTPDNSFMTHFSWFSWKNKFVLYGINCHSSEHLFGCVSLHRAKYSILNKQYSKEEYEALVPKIIEHMKKGGEWGEFPPARISYFDYNESIAQEYFPLKKEEVLAQAWKWKDPDPKEYRTQTCVIPDSILEATDVLSKEVLACIECGKNYKVIPLEFEFYKKISFPIPRKCPDCRHKARLAIRLPYQLWQRNCAKCSKSIQTPYAPTRLEVIYCEECYLKEIY
ncbi:MAG: hypothetical protein WC777_02670 [Candidatus Gracilibacteria bacterium]|jgi:hypothetical protein